VYPGLGSVAGKTVVASRSARAGQGSSGIKPASPPGLPGGPYTFGEPAGIGVPGCGAAGYNQPMYLLGAVTWPRVRRTRQRHEVLRRRGWGRVPAREIKAPGLTEANSNRGVHGNAPLRGH